MAITNPRDIPGLVAWYSAEYETSYANGAAMTSWADLSGNANHATAAGTNRPLWKSADGPAGGPAVHFSVAGLSGGFFQLPNILAGSAAGEIMMTVKADSTQPTINGFWAFGIQSGSNDGNYYPHSGVVYDNFGLPTGHRQSFTPTAAITSWRRYNVWSVANDWAARLDETTQATYAGASASFTSLLNLGRTWASGSSQECFKGWMGAVVIFNRKLTTTERDDLAAWLTANPSGGNVASPITLAGEPWAASATMLGGTPHVGLRVAGEPAAAAAVMLDGTIPVNTPVLVAGEPWSAPVALLDGTQRIAVPGEAWSSSADWLNGNVTGAPIILSGEAWPSPATWLDGVHSPTRNGLGLILASTTLTTVTPPLQPLPTTGTTTPPVEHITTPTVPAPVLIDGKPQ